VKRSWRFLGEMRQINGVVGSDEGMPHFFFFFAYKEEFVRGRDTRTNFSNALGIIDLPINICRDRRMLGNVD